jgi:Zn ribbon nucleic-acid-binding protein
LSNSCNRSGRFGIPVTLRQAGTRNASIDCMATVPVDNCPRCESSRVLAAFRSTNCSYYYCSDCSYMWDIDVAADKARKDDWPVELNRRAQHPA